MKKLLKIFFGLVLGFISLGVIIGMLTDEETTTTADPTPAAAEKKEKSSAVSLATYDKITIGDALTGKGGMTIDEVTKLFGSAPTKTNEIQSGETKMVTAIWQGKGFNFDKMITVTFINGGASAKTQSGL